MALTRTEKENPNDLSSLIRKNKNSYDYSDDGKADDGAQNIIYVC